MRVSAKADYAVRASLELAAAGDGPMNGEAIAEAQGIPMRFLEHILGELRHAGIVRSQPGVEDGYSLARGAGEVTIADVIRAVEGPLATVRSEAPEGLAYEGTAEPLRDVWLALNKNVRDVLDVVTLADVVDRNLPPSVVELAEKGLSAG